MSKGKPLTKGEKAFRGTFLITQAQAVALRALGEKLDRTDTWIIRKALEQYLEVNK